MILLSLVKIANELDDIGCIKIANDIDILLIKRIAMALIHDDGPAYVYRLQNANGTGPYAETTMEVLKRWFKGLFRFPKPYQYSPEHDPKVEDPYNLTPDPQKNYLPEEWQEIINNPFKYRFGFAKPYDAVKWFGDKTLKEYYKLGYQINKIKADKIWSSLGGQEVFFLPTKNAKPEPMILEEVLKR
jgi:hypothetical protein